MTAAGAPAGRARPVPAPAATAPERAAVAVPESAVAPETAAFAVHEPAVDGAATRVAAVVVHHAGLGDTLGCLRQLAAAGLAGRDVVVVANGAADVDRAALAAVRPPPRVVVLAANAGFAAGANAGLELALEGGADAALLINPDVAFGPGLARALAAEPGARAEVRMPEIVRADDPERTWFAGAWRGAWPGRWRRRRAGDPRRDVDVLWACCWLVGADAWRRVGPFDPGYFLYFEDVAWCDRARAAGVALRVVPEARLAHAGGRSFPGGAASAERRYWMSRGAVRYARGLGPRALLWRALVDVATGGAWLATGRWAVLRAHGAGARDGWRSSRLRGGSDADPRSSMTAGASVRPSTTPSASPRPPFAPSAPVRPSIEQGASSRPREESPARSGDSGSSAQPLAAPRCSFVVASGHLPTTAAALRAILAQTATGAVQEVLVFGGIGSGWPQDPRIRPVAWPPGPACSAYNEGLRRAGGTHVVFVDADCLLEPGWLEAALAQHDAGWHAVAGGVVVPDGPRLAVAYNLALFHGFLAGSRSGARPWLPTMALSVDARAAARIGPFRTDLARAYDVDWTRRLARAGFRLRFDGAMRASHHPCGITEEVLERTWFAGGACSAAARFAQRSAQRTDGDTRADGALRPRRAARRVVGSASALRVLGPLLAAAATARCVWRARRDRRVWGLVGVLWATKRAWCRGAAHAARHGPLAPAGYGYRVLPADPNAAGAPGLDAA